VPASDALIPGRNGVFATRFCEANHIVKLCRGHCCKSLRVSLAVVFLTDGGMIVESGGQCMEWRLNLSRSAARNHHGSCL
jgi:hypothetical protein